MPRPRRAAGTAAGEVADFRYDATRPNLPEAGLEAQGRLQERPARRYAYDPHLPPVLRFDATGEEDKLPPLLDEARRRPLTDDEAKLLADALRHRQPWLEWSGKREADGFAVEPVALHIHERVAAKAIVAAAARQDIQRSLFADPDLEYRERVQFYQHQVDWANRLILGDSLQVMASLAEREGLAGKVQMIYVDPPYGIDFSSNFQPLTTRRDVKNTDQDLTRDPETVRAYRDTWTLGVHSYLAYLRNRLTVARQLLSETGSIFVQIGEENLHRLRAILDEVFGVENFISTITFSTTTGFESSVFASSTNYLLWYARNVTTGIKFRPLFVKASRRPGEGGYRYVRLPNGQMRALTGAELSGDEEIPEGGALYKPDNILSQGAASTSQVFTYAGRQFSPGVNSHWKASFPVGMDRLSGAFRLHLARNSIQYVRDADDFPWKATSNVWTDTVTGQFTDEKIYAVQTATKVIERCLLMTTDPGDLVLDPTSGSGTTAYVAEKWGRRWIAIDTSRVANAIARQRLLTAAFDYYQLRDEAAGVDGGFVYQTVPHVTLKSIAQNQALDPVFAKHDPILADRLAALNAALAAVTPETRAALAAKLAAKERAEGKRGVTDADKRRWLLPKERWQEWEVPFDADPLWPAPLQEALRAYRAAWRAKMDEVNATIAASAEQEELADKPQVVKGIRRVSGPFTVESVLPAEERLDDEPSPIAGPDEDLETFGADGHGDGATDIAADPQNADAFIARMIGLLRQDGARFFGNRQVAFDRLDPVFGSVLHAEGEWRLDGATERTVAVSFGPPVGNVSARQVEQCIRLANRQGYDDLLFAGFGFDDAAQAAIQDDPNPDLRCHLLQIRPDVMMGDLLKTTPNSQIFTVLALPRTALEPLPNGEWRVTMEGMDVYDPVANATIPTGADKVAAWFLDTDYDGRTFCICQAFFPDKSAWEKLARSLKGVLDEDAFAAFSGSTSLPFKTGPNARACVKVIDPRGNEATRVLPLSEAAVYAGVGREV